MLDIRLTSATGTFVGALEITCQSKQRPWPPVQDHVYEYSWRLNTGKGVVHMGEVAHRYRDGWPVLLQRVLECVNGELPELRLEDVWQPPDFTNVSTATNANHP